MGFQTGLDARGKRTWGGNKDSMINGAWRATERLPRRVVVELTPKEFERLDRVCRGIAVSDFLRLVALRVVHCEQDQRIATHTLAMSQNGNERVLGPLQS